MACALQIGLFLLGAWLLSRPRVRLGGKEIRSPQTTLAGLILAAQLPIGIGVGLALGGAENIKASREGVGAAMAVTRTQAKYWWLDLALTGTSMALAGTIVATGLREPVFEPPPPDEPVGIIDFRAVMAERWDAERRAKPSQRVESGVEP